jgi:hypothetical protein
MKLLVLAAFAAATAAAAAFPAAAQKPTDRSLVVDNCFFVRDVGDRTVVGQHTLYFKVKDRAHMHAIAYYRVETTPRCTAGVESPTQHAGFVVDSYEVASHIARQVCRPADLRIRTTKGPDCQVLSMSRITPTEVAALPRRLRP